MRETNVEQSIRKEQREENAKTSHKNLINFFRDSMSALPSPRSYRATRKTRRETRLQKRTRGEKALSKAFSSLIELTSQMYY